MRGSELLKHGKLDQAAQAFRAAHELDPENLKVLALLGLTHFRANEFAAARSIYEQLCEKAQTDASHRLNLGLVYLKLNDADKAIAALEASRALDPSQGKAVSYLGLAYARAGRFVQAYRAFLLAGQTDLAAEIEINLAPGEREAIQVQLGRTPTPTPVHMPARTPSPHVIPRTQSEPRTKPPSAPPGGKQRTMTSQTDLAQKAAAAVELAKRADFLRDAEPVPDVSSPEITITRSEPEMPAIKPIEIGGKIPELSDSQRFVLSKPAEDGAPTKPLDGHSMVSLAVRKAQPQPTSAETTTTGALAAKPLAELATEDLVRPDDGSDPFEIAANGTLLVRVTERVMMRLDGVHITGGDLTYEVATRRSRGHQIDERFDSGGTSLHVVSGKGYLLAIPEKSHTFTAVALDDDILYVREDLVFAFESTLRWENGNVPGLRGKLHVVQFRGDGSLALRLKRPLVHVKLPPQGLVFVDAERLAGWVGRVIPRAVVPPSGGPLGAMCVECTGEGIILIEPAPERTAGVAEAPAPKPPPLPPPEPPQPEPEIAPEVADFAADLAAHSARDEI